MVTEVKAGMKVKVLYREGEKLMARLLTEVADYLECTCYVG